MNKVFLEYYFPDFEFKHARMKLIIIDLIKVPTEKKTHVSIYLG